jgi:hypothetical protein
MPQANDIYPSELVASLSHIVQNIADLLVGVPSEFGPQSTLPLCDVEK